MSVQRDLFEAAVRSSPPNWAAVVDNLNALAMFEMLSALAALSPALRAETVRQSRQILMSRGWRDSADRIEFAQDVINDRRLTSWLPSIPDSQVEEARNFLASFLAPPSSQAGTAAFQTPDAAAIAAIDEVNPISIAINREFSGTIFRQGNLFGFTRPERGGAADSNPNVPVPSGTTAVAIYHTHGNGVGRSAAELYSGDDMVISERLRRFSYLGTPGRRIKKLIPASLMTPEERQQNPLGVRQITLR